MQVTAGNTRFAADRGLEWTELVDLDVPYFLRGCHPVADRFPVTLRKGENHVVVFTNWLFYVSLENI